MAAKPTQTCMPSTLSVTLLNLRSFRLCSRRINRCSRFAAACRSSNVALGGSLYEDIASALPAAQRHDWYPNYPRDYLAHTVEVEPSSHLARILGTHKLRTNSLHHQAIRQPAPALDVVAHAEDGVIEAVELPEKRFAIGVQWHPECLPEEPAMQRLFKAFVIASKI